MKKIILFLMFIAPLFSCDKSDDPNEQDVLNGKWNLVYVSCECQPVDLEVGEHIWTFDLSQNKLNVQNNVTEQLHTILETGSYEINVTQNKINILATEYDYYFENNKLYLADHPESDGPLIEFVRD
ncbi:hypothetical protein [Aquimarina sp. 2201CG14-23]|uniref:hypothetical protein n=1 Tax=Aquimarina mycalae TaxID=3040073 RepID=UPI002478066B|nr:hypothetical protein [Aquimarina sp. 2201CG14-23]MDH7447111.1 hypothetical protein [Aquimarina sp. 2201CG14-23]